MGNKDREKIPGGFGEGLEDKVEHIVNQESKTIANDSLENIVIQSMAMALDHIKQIRSDDQAMRLEMTRQECRLGTQLKQLERPAWQHLDLQTTHELSHARHNIRLRLDKLDQERRSLTISKDAQIRPLQDHLLSLHQKHNQLQLSNEDRVPLKDWDTKQHDHFYKVNKRPYKA